MILEADWEHSVGLSMVPVRSRGQIFTSALMRADSGALPASFFRFLSALKGTGEHQDLLRVKIPLRPHGLRFHLRTMTAVGIKRTMQVMASQREVIDKVFAVIMDEEITSSGTVIGDIPKDVISGIAGIIIA